MYRNNFYLLSDDCIYLIYFVEDTYRVIRENSEGKIVMDDNNTNMLRVGNETIISIKNKYSFVLNEKIMSLIKGFKKLRISVNRLGDEEIITEHTVEVPEIFIGQLIAYTRL